MTAPRPLRWTQAELHQLFDYDRLNGVLIWRVGKRKGHPAGTIGKAGYLYICIGGVRNCRVHRVIWKWMTGEDPELDVDHRNRVRHDNAWTNLRTLTRAQNSRNVEAANVSFHRPSGLWHARVRFFDKRLPISLGYYHTEAEARAAGYGAMKLFTHMGGFNPYEYKTE